MTPVPAPRFVHDDCNGCVFLGYEGKHDVYACAQGGHPTIVMRFGNRGPAYNSGWFLFDDLPEDLRARIPDELLAKRGAR